MTELQLGIYEYVRDFIVQSEGLCPSVQAISDAFDLKSKGRAKRNIDALIAMGKLSRTTARTHNLALPDTTVDLATVPSAAMRDELARRGEFPGGPALDTPTRPCGFSSCDQRVTRGHLLCRSHYYQLPLGLRSELREHQRHGNRQAYQDAWRRACDVLEGARG